MSLHLFQHAQIYRALAGKQGGSMMLSHLNKYLFSLLPEHMKPPLTGGKDLLVPVDVMVHYLWNRS